MSEPKRSDRFPETAEKGTMRAQLDDVSNVDVQSRYRVSHGLVRVESISRTWAGVEVSYNEKHPGSGVAYADLSSERPTVVICLDQKGGICEPRLKLDEATPRSRYDMGYFIWVPANRTVWGYAESVRLVRDVTLKFQLDEAIELVGGGVDLEPLKEPMLMVYDSRVTQCAHLLANACIDPFENDRVYGEGIVAALLSAVFHSAAKDQRAEQSSGLAPWQLRLAIKHLESHYDEEISLSDLAGLTRLSESRFARAFKASTGIPPYTFLLRHRVTKAKELLLIGKKPLSEIAMELGFADQSHFGKVFRRIAGITPREWQQSQTRRTT